ncbi:hypothetical protein AB4Z21_38895, partial [Paenibacillus sp. MCAF20]
SEICSGATLVSIKESRSNVSGVTTIREEPFQGRISKVTVEQRGPVRAVVKLEGKHQGGNAFSEICSGATLVSIKESRSNVSGVTTIREEPFQGRISKVTVEQRGPVRAVVKLEGKH